MSTLQHIAGEPLTEMELNAVMRELAAAQHEAQPECGQGAIAMEQLPTSQAEVPKNEGSVIDAKVEVDKSVAGKKHKFVHNKFGKAREGRPTATTRRNSTWRSSGR